MSDLVNMPTSNKRSSLREQKKKDEVSFFEESKVDKDKKRKKAKECANTDDEPICKDGIMKDEKFNRYIMKETRMRKRKASRSYRRSVKQLLHVNTGDSDAILNDDIDSQIKVLVKTDWKDEMAYEDYRSR